MRQIFPKQNQEGQIAVAILLLTTVLLTVAVSMATRTSEEINLATLQSESTKVFNAAETGIERALLEGEFSNNPQNIDLGQIIPNTNTSYSITPLTQAVSTLQKGQAATINLEGADPSQPLTLKWAKENNVADRASLIVSLFYQQDASDTTADTVEYYAIGLPNDNTGRDDNFDGSTELNSDPEGYKNSYQITLASGKTPVLMRITPVYFNTQLVIDADNLAAQAHLIRSQSRNSDPAAGNVETKTVEVVRSLPTAPAFMDYALYSRGWIQKQTNE